MELKIQSRPVDTSRLTSRAADDLILINAAKEGCQKSYTKLLSRYKKSVYVRMYKLVHNTEDAEDLTLEAFEKAFRKLQTYAPSHAFSTWLFTIARNNGIDHMRKKRISTLSIDEPVEAGSDCDFSNNIQATTLDPEREVINAQRKLMVRHMVNQLNDKYRQMIELRYYNELSYIEISKQLDIPLGTVKAQLHRAKQLFYDIVIQKGNCSAHFDDFSSYYKRRNIA